MSCYLSANLLSLSFIGAFQNSLSEMLKEAQGNKDVIVNETKAKQEYLESLQPKLNSILQVSVI